MSSSNRELKLRLHAIDPRCHWCKRETVLTNIKEIKGKPNPLMATIDHVISKYNPERWVRPKEGEQRRVLACWDCNQRRCEEERKSLPAHVRIAVGKGYTLNPRGKATFGFTLAESVEEVYKRIQADGVEIIRFDETEESIRAVEALKNMREPSPMSINPLVDKLPALL